LGRLSAKHVWRWRGIAMGADATITIHHADRKRAERLLSVCVAEISRLERVFSLHRAESAIAVL
jgi:thiamine biosynthesis lipoprotein